MKNSNLAILLGCIAALALSGNANVIRTVEQADEVTYQYCSLDSTTSHVNCLASVFRFTADVSDLSDECAESSNITLNNLSWRVQVCKTNNNVNAVLVANSEGARRNWTTEAEASIKVFAALNPNGSPKAGIIERKLPKSRFTVDNSARAVDPFTSYNEFMNYYVTENRATFEIALSTVPLSEKNTTDIDVIKTRLHVKLDNVKDMTKSETHDVTVRGIRWKVVTQRIGGNGGMNGALAVYLEAADADFDNSLSYDVEIQFKMLTFDKNVPAQSAVVKKVYHWGSTKGGIDTFLNWHQFIDAPKKFVSNDRANLLVEFKVSEPKNLWDFYGATIQA